MLPDRVSNPGPLSYESGALPIALRGPASQNAFGYQQIGKKQSYKWLVYYHQKAFYLWILFAGFQ